MKTLTMVALAWAGAVGLTTAAEESKDTAGEIPVHTLKFAIPAKQREGSTVKKWGLAAPVVDGFSNPNLVVYEQNYIERYVQWAVNTPTECGGASFTVVTKDGEVTVNDGLEHAYLGKKFRAEDLLKFIKVRAEGGGEVREFKVAGRELDRILRNHAESLSGKRLSESPWERDIRTALVLLGQSQYAPAHPVCKKLLEDEREWIRYAAAIAMGRIGNKVPEALEDLRAAMGDKKLGSVASEGLRIANAAAVPMLIDAMTDKDWMVRNRAVHALPWIEFKAARPAFLAALRHKDGETRSWGVGVLIDVQGRGVRVSDDEIVAALRKILADPKLAEGDRRSVEIALGNMQDPKGS